MFSGGGSGGQRGEAEERSPHKEVQVGDSLLPNFGKKKYSLTICVIGYRFHPAPQNPTRKENRVDPETQTPFSSPHPLGLYWSTQVPGEQWLRGDVREHVQDSHSGLLHQRVRPPADHDPK